MYKYLLRVTTIFLQNSVVFKLPFAILRISISFLKNNHRQTQVTRKWIYFQMRVQKYINFIEFSSGSGLLKTR